MILQVNVYEKLSNTIVIRLCYQLIIIMKVDDMKEPQAIDNHSQLSDATVQNFAMADRSIIVKNNKAFAFGLFCLQLFLILMFGVFIRPTPYINSILLKSGKVDGLDNGLVTTVGAALLVLVGFGLYFSYLRNTVWSGLGFNFLITVIVFQYYFLINGFWSKANVQLSDSSFSGTYILAYLSEQNGDTGNGGTQTIGATAVGAFKCALSMCIAFAAIGGRGGPLEALVIVVIGVVTYELNRQVLSLFSVNVGGTMTIFEFGGFYGTTIAALMRWTSHSTGLQHHKEYISQKFNVILSLVGAAFCWVFFPSINMDIPSTLFVYSNGGISTIYCVSASVATSIAFSLILNGKLMFRDVITAPIAGGVVIGSAAIYIYNPLEALLFGFVAGILQVLFNRVEKKLGSHPYWSNGVFFLFGVQGFIGGIFSSIPRAVNRSAGTYAAAYNDLIPKYVYDQRGQVSAAFVTLAISLISGFFTYIFIRLVNQEQVEDFYHDRTYWIMNDDGLSDRQQMVAASEMAFSQNPDNKSEGNNRQ